MVYKTLMQVNIHILYMKYTFLKLKMWYFTLVYLGAKDVASNRTLA